MATSAPTPSSFRQEKVNYIRLSSLLVEIGRKVLRDVFDSIHNPANLHGILYSGPVHNILKNLRTARVLYTQQWNTLYPASGTASSAKFDITLLFLLLRNICGLRAPGTGWDDAPLPADVSREADLVRIKRCRNDLAHNPEQTLTNRELENHWVEMEAVLTRLGGSRYLPDIQRVRFQAVDPENERNFEVLLHSWEEGERSTLDAIHRFESRWESRMDQRESNTSASITIVGDVRQVSAAGVALAWAAGSAYILHRYQDDPETMKDLLYNAIFPGGVITGVVVNLLQGSFKILIKIQSLDALDYIWESYVDGDLQTKLEKVLITKELSRRAPKKTAKLKILIMISEVDYRKARTELVEGNLRSGDMTATSYRQKESSRSFMKQHVTTSIKTEAPKIQPGKMAPFLSSLHEQSIARPKRSYSLSTLESNIQGVASTSAQDQILYKTPSKRRPSFSSFSFLPGAASTSAQDQSTSKTLILHNVKEFEIFIQSNFNISLTKEQSKWKEKERLRKINEFVKEGYDNFAFSRNSEMRASDVKKLDQLCDSTGALVVRLNSGERKVVGTCFRVGPKYVITNRHVYVTIQGYRTRDEFQDVYIDFSYKSRMLNLFLRPTFFCTFSNKFESEELDYIIFEVYKNSQSREMPKSVTSFFTISAEVGAQEGEFLTLVGHPDGSSETMTNVLCPLRHPGTLDVRFVASLSKRELDQRSQSYDTSTFFHGSSGSPGVLLQKGYLMVLHVGGFTIRKDDKVHYIIEQGILMAAIVADVKKKYGDKIAEKLFDLPSSFLRGVNILNPIAKACKPS